jgi:hypothetical protein
MKGMVEGKESWMLNFAALLENLSVKVGQCLLVTNQCVTCRSESGFSSNLEAIPLITFVCFDT